MGRGGDDGHSLCRPQYRTGDEATADGGYEGVYRTGPRPIRAARKYGGIRTQRPAGGRGSPHPPASHLGRPLYIAGSVT